MSVVMRCATSFLMATGLAALVGAVEPAIAAPPQVRFGDLDLPEVEPKAVPRSRVPLVLGIESAWAKQQLEQRLPLLLHQENNREVASGVLLDAKVTRGNVELHAREDGVVVAAPIVLDLDVRSRLGSMIMPLGRCRSTMDFEVNLGSKLASDGTLTRPTARALVREPCRLAVFDVTPIIQQEVERRISAAQAQTDQYLAQANQRVEGIHAALFRSLSNPASGCVRFVPERILQTRVAEEQGVVTTRLVVDGTVANHCGTVAPPAVRVDALAGPADFDLAWARRISLQDLSQIITQRLAADGLKGATIQGRSVRLDDRDQLGLYLRLPKGEGWVFVRPEIANQQLVFRGAISKDAAMLKSVQPILEGIALPIDTVAVEMLAHRLTKASNELSMIIGTTPGLKQRLQIEASTLRTVTELQVDREALVVVVRRRQGE